MKTMPLLLVTLLVAAGMAVFAVWAAGQVPPGTELPTHWNAAGEIDGTMPALQALLFPVGVTVFIGLLFAVVPAIEPLQDRLSGSAPLLRTAWIGTVALLVALQAYIAAPVFGYHPGQGLIFALVGLLFVGLGNMLPKSRPGFFVGIRTPWTITNSDNWVATHRLGGKLFMLAGFAMILAGLAPISAPLRVVVVLASVFIASLVPVFYSWRLWQRDNRTESGT